MALIKGVTVQLYEKTQTGTDDFNAPIYTEVPVDVENVLITPVEDEDVIRDLQLYGKKVIYELCIPKGDTHVWEDRKVGFWGCLYKTVGFSRQYIDANVPLEWNKKIRVERYG